MSVFPVQSRLDDSAERGHDASTVIKRFGCRQGSVALPDRIRRLLDVVHPALAPVRDIWIEDGMICLTRAYVAGTSVDSVRCEGITLAHLKRYCIQLAGGLAALHAAGLVHGNIKPSNVFIAGGQAILTDAGLNELREPDAGGLAPQEGQADPRGDLYALGVLLSGLMAGRDVPPDWSHLIDRAVAPEPDARFQTASQLREALLRLSADLQPPEPATLPPAPSEPPVTHRARPELHAEGPSPAGPTARLRLALGAVLLAPLILILLSLLASAVLLRAHDPAGATGTTLRLWAGNADGSGTVSSGDPLTIHWAGQPDATRYRVQIALRRTGFGHPLFQTDLRSLSYTLELPGAASYAVRVQPRVSDAWLPFTPSLRVQIGPPALSVPSLRSPGPAVVSAASAVRFCWSAVSGAASYILRLTGRAPLATTETCRAVALPPGSYRWRVAAVTQAIGSYTGPFTQPRLLRVASPTPLPVPTAVAPASAVQAPPVAPAVPAPAQPAPQPAAPQPAPAQPSSPGGASSTTCIPFVSC